MPSTYSPSLKLELIGTGEQAGTWGTSTNYNLGTLLEQAITGVVTLNMGDANYTMTNYNGLSDEARNAVLVLQGPITTPQYLIAPSGQQKMYVVRNITGNTVTITTTTGNGVGIANSVTAIVYTDGTNFYPASTLNYIDGNLTVTGYTFLQNSVAMATKANATVSIYGNVYGNVNTGQWYIPVGNTASRAANGSIGIFRYNSELKFYEGYSDGTWVRFQTYPEGVYNIDYLVVAGGGGSSAGYSFGGGGGGGGWTASTLSVTPGATYTMVVGAGGTAGAQGTQSSITGVTIATGGGAGGAADNPGGFGGSGGGGGSKPNEYGIVTGGAGIAGQGFNGGAGAIYSGGGGGGAGAQGGTAVNDSAGSGGAGIVKTITGAAVYYAGGGGGGGGGAGAGGAGGGGNGSAGGGSPSNGGTNTGGGAGSGGYVSTALGGSGVIILSVPSVSYSGVTTGSPTVTISGANTILKYTVSGTYTA